MFSRSTSDDYIFFSVNYIVMLLWFVESEVANSALAGKLIEEDDVEMRPERVSASCLDENVCLQSICTSTSAMMDGLLFWMS